MAQRPVGLWRRLDADTPRNSVHCELLCNLGFNGSLTVKFTDGVVWGGRDPATDESLEALFAAAAADLAFLLHHLN